MNCWTECTPPREAPAPSAGILGMSCHWSGKHLDSLWAKGGVKPGISRLLLRKIPQVFQPLKLKPTGVKKHLPTSYPGTSCRSKGSQSPL